MDRHQQVAVAVAVPPGRSTAVLPRQLESLFPVHADFVQPGGLRGGEASLFLSGPDKALVFQPAAHGHAPEAVGARHVQRLSLCRHLLCGGIIALPVGVQRAAELLVPGLGGHHLQTPQRGQARGEQNGELGTEHRQLLFPDAGIDGAGKRIALFFLYRLDFGDERTTVPQLGHRLKFVISPNDAGDLRPVKALAPVAISGHIRSLLSRLCFGFFNPPPCW